MERRAFFKTCLAAFAAPLTVPLTAVAAERRTLIIQESPIAGLQYHAGEALRSLLKASQPLTLVREAANSYDQRAVRMEWNGRKLGYVPRQENAAVAQMLDRGGAAGGKDRAARAIGEPVGLRALHRVSGRCCIDA